MIHILGAGSIGCYLGGRLLQGGANVRFIGRARYQAAIKDHGLQLTHAVREPAAFQDVDFQVEPDALRGASLIGLCVKSQDTEEAAALIKRFAPDAHVVSFQNGVSNPTLLNQSLTPGQVSGAVVPFNVTSPEPGRFHCGTTGPLIIADTAPAAMVDALRAGGETVELTDNIDGHLWAKLLVNLNNALNALWGGSLRDGLLQRGYRRVLCAMIEEGMAVAQADGVSLATFNGRAPAQLIKLMNKPDWLYRFIMDRIAKIDPTARSSMLDDLELGRASEIDYLQGEIVSRAANLGLAVPVSSAVLKAVRAAFEAGESPRMSGAEMQASFLA